MATIPRATTAEYAVEHQLAFGQVEDLLKLQKAAQKINSILDLDRLIDKVVNDVARSFGCVEADVYLHDEERGELTLACAHGCAGCEVCGNGQQPEDRERGHGRLCRGHRPDALCARCAERPVLHRM